jgi:energy-coupling factor transporter ATP-binding protein EcfA2
MPNNINWLSRLAWIVLAGGPPVVILGLSPDLIRSHPTVAAILVLLYEIALGVLSFAGKVVHELEQRWIKQAADFFDRTIRRRLSGFGRHYRDYVIRSQRHVDLKGLATIGFYTPELDEVFVDVSLARRAPSQVPTDLLASLSVKVTERLSIHEFLNRREQQRLAVIGVPGSGKTTLLRHTAREVCRRTGRRAKNVPMLLLLRDHVDAIVGNPLISLPELLRRTIGPMPKAEPEGWFELQLRRGRCVVLLDGLDEVARQQDRRRVADWVEQLTKHDGRNDYVITSRPQGYRETPITGVTALQVLAFTEEQVARFVRGWYVAVEQESTNSDPDEARVRAEPQAEDLLERLRSATSLYDLTVNPLLLTMIANVHRYRGALPGSRSDLYDEICQVMLWRRQESKRLALGVSGDKKKLLLCALAFAMMRRRTRDLSEDDIGAELTGGLLRTAAGMSAADFVADISSNGLLVERERGMYSFAHLTFQEYLAATYIRDKGLVDVLVKAVDDVWWRETILLYVAKSNADPIIEACLASTGTTAMMLAFDCAAEATEVAQKLRGQLGELLASALLPDMDAERRRQMAGVLVAQHLRKRITVQGNARVCVEPITAGLYWLFLQDHPRHEPDGPAVVAPTNQAPVTGVRASDTLAFTNWVNELIRGDVEFRLPTEAEFQELTDRRKVDQPNAPELSVWVATEPTGQTLGTLSVSGAEDYQVTAHRLGQDIANDFRLEPATLCTMLLMRTVAVLRLLSVTARWDPTLAANHYLRQDISLISQHTKAILLNSSAPAFPTLKLANLIATDFVRGEEQGHDSERLVSHALERVQAEAAQQRRGQRTLLEDMLCPGLDDLHATTPQMPPDWRYTATGGDYSKEVVLTRLDAVQGIAVSKALGKTLRESATDYGTWSVDFSREFRSAVGLDVDPVPVSPDTLLTSFNSRYQARLAKLAPSLDGPTWRRYTAANLERLALMAARREIVVLPGYWRAIRLAALCLAVEAKQVEDEALGEMLVKIAGGALLLQRRQEGAVRPDETILLATS